METYTVLYIGCIIEEGSILNSTTFGVRIVLERKQEGSLCLRAVAPPEAPTARNELSWLSREDSGRVVAAMIGVRDAVFGREEDISTTD